MCKKQYFYTVVNDTKLLIVVLYWLFLLRQNYCMCAIQEQYKKFIKVLILKIIYFNSEIRITDDLMFTLRLVFRHYPCQSFFTLILKFIVQIKNMGARIKVRPSLGDKNWAGVGLVLKCAGGFPKFIKNSCISVLLSD